MHAFDSSLNICRDALYGALSDGAGWSGHAGLQFLQILDLRPVRDVLIGMANLNSADQNGRLRHLAMQRHTGLIIMDL